MEIVILFVFGAFCISFGYLFGSARAEWLHYRVGKLVKKMEQTQFALEQLQNDIECTLSENGYLEEEG